MIKKLHNNLRKNKNFQKGSALIIALLLIGVLLTLTLGLGSLVMREVRITNDVINEGKAYYAAEAGIESGLLDIILNLDVSIYKFSSVCIVCVYSPNFCRCKKNMVGFFCFKKLFYRFLTGKIKFVSCL